MRPRRGRWVFTAEDGGFVAVLALMAVLGIGPGLKATLTPVFSPAVQAIPPIQLSDDSGSEWIEIALEEHRLRLHRADASVALEVPVGVGKAATPTPTGQFEVIEMVEEPVWQNPFNPSVVYSEKDPRNPLGPRWLGFKQAGLDDYGLHGTSNPASIGQSVTNGCVRLRNADIIQLYARVQEGTPVVIH